MKKIFFLVLLCIIPSIGIAQTFSYGIMLGINTSASASKGGGSFLNDRSSTFTNSGNYAKPSFGAYAEYNFTEKWGIKTEVLFHNTVLEPTETRIGQLKISMIELSPNIKFDFGDEYRKGAYLIFGPKITLLNSIAYEGNDVDDNFNKTLIGIQTGIGGRMFQYIDLQFKLNYDFTSFYENPITNNNDFFLGANLHLGIDVERLLNKK